MKTYIVVLFFPLLSKTNEKISNVSLEVEAESEEAAIDQVFGASSFLKVEDSDEPLDKDVYYLIRNAVRVTVVEKTE